jgi:hypothetical protein
LKKSKPSRYLKDQNKPQLWLAMAANAVAVYAAAQWADMTTLGLRGLLTGLVHLLPVGLAVLFTTVATSLIDVEMKYRVVFLRWRHALPGHRAFSKYGPRDPRVDMKKVKQLLGNKLPSDLDEQNAVWYGLFKQVENEPPVLGVHRDFLLLRDYAALAVLFIPVFGVAAAFAVRPTTVLVAYIGVLLLQFVIVRAAASNCGKRFVTTVLAEAASMSLPRAKRSAKSAKP